MIAQSQDFNESALEGRRAWLDTGSSAAVIQIFGGVRPAPNGTPGSPMLVQIVLDKPCGVVNASQLVLTAAVVPVAVNGGTATWARWLNGNGDWAMDTDAGAVGGSAEVQLANTAILAGAETPLVSAILS